MFSKSTSKAFAFEVLFFYIFWILLLKSLAILVQCYFIANPVAIVIGLYNNDSAAIIVCCFTIESTATNVN